MIFNISKNGLLAKKQLCTCSTLFFEISSPLFCTTTTLHVFLRIDVVCVPVNLFFSLPLIFILVAARISHWFFISHSSSFSVIHV